MAGNPPNLPTENIDEVILRLLALEPNEVDELDYDSYRQYLKELLVEITSARRKIGDYEFRMIKDEFKRVRGKKGRFRIKNKKAKINSNNFAVGGIRKQIKGAQQRIMLMPVGGIPKSDKDVKQKVEKVSKNNDNQSLINIDKTLDSILKTLTDINKEDRKQADKDRKETENKKRRSRESALESKPVSALKTAIGLITKPFQSIIDKIINFVVMTLLGRAMVKLIDWVADPKNKDKIKNIIRFFKDWWPALLGGYILFGTGFGKGVKFLTKVALSGIGKITKLLPLLLKIAKNPLAIGAGLFTFGAWGPKLFPGLVNDNKKVPTVKAYGGGHANFANLFSGLVKGKKGRDKVPAMLTDGEFVMSTGAVQKYGVDTLEAMNASGGGDNNPKVVSGTAYAYGGGLIGTEGRKNTPFSKDPVDAVRRFINHKFGVDVDRPNTWGPSSKQFNSSKSSSSVSTGSLLTDPLGAATRISKQLRIPPSNLPSGIKIPGLPGGGLKIPGLPGSGIKVPKLPGGIKVPGLPSTKKGGFLDNLKSSTYRDAGSIYAKQMFGGFGGPLSERDLSKESQAELKKAIERAKKRTSSEIAKAEAKIRELRAQGAKDGNSSLETQKSFLEKLKSGGTRVQYTDYADEKGNLSESAKNAKNILGQFWAYERDKKEGGGYRIEDKYDFDMLKKKGADGKMRDMNMGELITEGVFGKGKTIQQRLQAAYLLNPLKGKGDVDMILGGNRSAQDNAKLSAQKLLASGGLGSALLAGAFRGNKPKDKNTKALESKRPWWDKMGWFGGASGQMARNKKANQEFLKRNPGTKLYDKPQKNTGQPYKSRFSRPRNAVKTPVKPLPKPKPKPQTTYKGGARSSGSSPSGRGTGVKPPSFSPRHGSGTRRTQAVYGVRK